MKTVITIAFFASLLMAGMGYNMPSFKSYDLNNDGMISAQEFQDARDARMAKQAASGKMMRNSANAPSFEMIDMNKDGSIDKNEFMNHQRNRMQNTPAPQGKGGGMGQGMYR